MRSQYARSLAPLTFALLALAMPAAAQDGEGTPTSAEESGRRFGFEFEFAGQGNRVVSFDEMPWENYEKLMKEVVRYYGGNPEEIKRIDFMKPTSNLEKFPEGERPLFRAEWTDAKGRTWMVEPEYVASTGYDGYELVTPPLNDPSELKGVLDNVRSSGLVREGLKSGVHLTIDGTGLVKPNGDARALVNLMMLHENNEPMLRRLFNPVRGGGHANRFARSLAVDHEDLLKEINSLPADQRTRERLEEMFKAREGREIELQEIDPLDPEARSKLWKYRAMNLAKALNINEHHNGNTGVVEFRMFDLHALEDAEVHRLEARYYRAMVEKAVAMAEAGEAVTYQPRAAMPAGEDPAVRNTPQDPVEAKAKAREMIEAVGLDPAEFESLIEKNVARHRDLPTESEFRAELNGLSTDRVEHNGKAFTYGFELEGSGEGFAMISRPKDAEVNERWDTMSESEKKAYYREVVGSDRHAVKSHFELDLQRYPWLDPNWKVEYTGNWEIRSLPLESIKDITSYMREVKKLTAGSGKGFHLHMRDNGVDWNMLESRGAEFADWIERSSNWVWLERARRLGTMTSLKSWSNARMKPGDVENIANMRSSARATIRNTVPSSKEYIDLEIRGFTLNVDGIETLAKIYTEGLKTGNFGPWSYKANPLPMPGQGNPKDASLLFTEHMERYLREVEGKPMTPELREVLEGMQIKYPDRAKGDARTLPTNLATPLLPWDADASLDESLRRDIKFGREDYLRSLRFTANKIMNGEYGLDLAVASAEGLQRHLGVTEAEAEALVAYRRAGGDLKDAESLARALALGPDGERLSRLNTFDLSSGDLTEERLGLSEADATLLREYRSPMDVLDAMGRAGLEEAKVMDMIERSGALDLVTAEATAEKIAERTGISLESAEKVIEYRATHENLGRTGTWSSTYSSVHAAKELREAGVLTEAEAELVKIHTSDANLERVDADVLQERFGLEAETAEKIVWLRDAHSIGNQAALEKAGLSAEEAERLLKAAEAMDVKKATLDELAERTGLPRERLLGVLRLGGVDLKTASATDLAERLGISAEEAGKLVTAREAGNTLGSAEKLVEAGLSEEVASRVLERAKGVNAGSASAEELRRAGVSESDAERIVALREKAGSAPELDVNEIERQVRFKVKKWARETRLSEALLRSLLPRARPVEVTTEAPATEGEGFGPTRRGRGSAESRVSIETVSAIFEAVKEGTVARMSVRAAEGDADVRALAEANLDRVEGLKLEVVESADIMAEHNSGKVRVSTGLLNELYARAAESVPPAERAAFRARSLAVIFGHEAAHASGISAEAAADAEAMRILELSRFRALGPLKTAEIRATVEAFNRPTGASWVDNMFNRMRSLFRYGSTAARTEELARVARGEADRFANYRRADGTLKWRELTRDRALQEGAGVANFALALFLKEVAVVAATGDRARIEEFFDGLMTTDFYKQYGLFVAGARVGEVAYTKYLQRYVKPKFVNGMLKTNLVLAAGMALPLIVEGKFEGKAFAISLGSLGLSSAAVKAGVEGIKWVMDLRKAKQTGTLARIGVAGSRLAKIGGWFYTAAELAVVLYFSEKIEGAVNAYLDREAARDALADASERFLAAANDANATPESVAAAAQAYHEAWIDYRNFLYGPLHMDEALLADRLQRVARQAKIKADERKAATDRIARNTALKRNIERRYGSLEAYAEARIREEEAEIEREVNMYLDSYKRSRDEHLDEVYRDHERGTPFLHDVDHLTWLLAGGKAGGDGDPYHGRTDSFANWGRSRAQSALRDALEDPSLNRLEAYDDEENVLALVANSLHSRGRSDLAEVVEGQRDATQVLKTADQRLIDGNGLIDVQPGEGPGIIRTLEGAGSGR